MAQAVSFGQITIMDLTDLGSLSVYPTANRPLSVIYSPDQNTFTPNWGSSNLVITPVIYYGGNQLTAASTGTTVTWKRQEGSSAEANLGSGETVSNGVLTVSANKFTANSTMISYIVRVQYIEPNSQATLRAEGKITFSLVKQASTVKTAIITGDQIFKYGSDQKITGATSITLEGTVTGPISISAWQYQKADGTWATYPNSGTADTLTVDATDSTFFDDKCVIKLATSDSNVYDIHTITKLRDGVAGGKGDKGDTGEAAINVILGGQFNAFPCTSDNKTEAETPVLITFGGYKGASRVACSVNNPGQLFGISPKTPTSATTSADGKIEYTIPAGTSISAASGTLPLVFSCEGKTINMSYGWSRSTSGESAVILQLNTPQGNVFRDGTGTLTIEGILYRGSENVSSSASWAWAKYANSSYQTITGEASSIKINGSTVDSFASYRCIATYDGKSYTAYASLIDKTDPIQVEVLSSIGDQIVNSTGAGAFYVLVYKNGVEVDQIKSRRFLTSAPSSATAGDLYYHVDTKNKTLTLKRYSGSSWVNQSVTYSGTYNWTHMDKDGNTVSGPATSGKVIYVDGTLFDKKMISTVEVTI